MDGISPREAEVLDALREGRSNPEIAARLYLSVRTVESHVSSLLRKLDATDRRELARLARQQRLSPPRASSSAVAQSSFLGRHGELAQLVAGLRDHPVVTVVGAGGCGKSRLAVELAQREKEGYPDGVLLVELAPLHDPSLVPEAIAAAVGVRSPGHEPVLDVLADYLRHRRALLLLDNCEHLVGAVADAVSRLIDDPGRIAVLATSREPLRLRAEHVVALSPLPVAPAGAPVEQIDSSPAVALFVSRAADADPGFALTSDNRSLVRDLCASLAGLPLALELAAARLAQLPVTAVAASLEQSMNLLSDGPRDDPARHRTMRDALDWSYQLLDASEQALFRRLAVLVGAFSLHAAVEVAGEGDLADLDVPRRLAGLVSKSLVMRDGDGFRLLEPVRQYALGQLRELGEHDAASGRLLSHLVTMTRELGVGRRSAGTPEALAVLRDSEPVIRSALEWGLDAAHPERFAAAVELCGACMWRWFIDGVMDEGRGWCERALVASGSCGTGERMLALYGVAGLALGQGDVAAAMAAATELAELSSTVQDLAFSAFAADLRGDALWAWGRLEEAQAELDRAADLSRRAGLLWHEAFAVAELARVVFDGGDLPRAVELAEQALAAAHAVGEDMPIGFALDVLAAQQLALGERGAAAVNAEQSLEHYQRIGYQEGVASVLQTLARIAVVEADVGRARTRITQVLQLHRRLGHRGGLATAIECAAELASVTGDHALAARLLGKATSIRGSARIPVAMSQRPAAEAMHEELVDRLGDELDALLAAGSELDVDQVSVLVGSLGATPR